MHYWTYIGPAVPPMHGKVGFGGLAASSGNFGLQIIVTEASPAVVFCAACRSCSSRGRRCHWESFHQWVPQAIILWNDISCELWSVDCGL
jgi:hypothetical protein